MRLSIVGLLVGTVFFAFSLTPTLLPRPFLIQGVLSGLSFAAGYAFGVSALWLWKYLQLPVPGRRTVRYVTVVASILCALVAISFLWRAAEWQNSIRDLMGISERVGGQPIVLGLIAALVFFLLLFFARLFRWVMIRISNGLHRYVSLRVAQLVGITAAVMLFWTVIDGVLVSSTLRMLDRSFQQLDALIEPELPRPMLAWQTGSRESLISWEDLGRQGRRFVAGGPTQEELSTFFAEPVPAPIRVYVGLNSAETPEQRARLALAELQRVGGFERAMLLLVTPTGTGWVDASSQDTFEFLHRGDTATVVAQYSYLNSPLTLMTDGGYGAENARALFREIYGYWRTLPRDARPRLYLGNRRA